MRPVRLDLDGFTVFREPTTVDFTDTDFFALVGPTGSGKSTVLDAICFALYGTVPRWGDRRAIGNALAPSAAEARVRLIFESAGKRYVLTRVVRRDTKGTVSTKHAGLEMLTPGLDLTKLEFGLEQSDIAEVLAGTPGEVDTAVLTVVGLPYEQFTKCVVLPQGEFAAFLHAKPAERQKILVNLLGLEVYGRIREKAQSEATTAETKLKVLDDQLHAFADIDDAALAAAASRVEALRTVAAAVDRIAPQLQDARHLAEQAAAALATLDAEIGRLAAVSVPADAAGLAASAATARAAVAGAMDAARAAEEREDKLRGELQAAGDAHALRRLLDHHASRAKLLAEAAGVRSTLTGAEAEHERAARALASARADATAARQALESAFEAYNAAMAADQAAALRPGLTVGAACPVCEQPVHALPPMPHEPAVVAAKKAGEVARKRSTAADKTVEERDRAARDLDRALTTARAQADQLDKRIAGLERDLEGAPPPEALQRDLDGIAALTRRLEQAGAEVRKAREAHRGAARQADQAEERLRSAWRAFDGARDGLAAFGPPPTNRDDLADAWATLHGWAVGEAGRRRAGRPAAQDEVRAAERRVAGVRDELAAAFTAAGLAVPGGDPARDAAIALERADAAKRRIEERRADAARMREQRDEVAREAQVAKALAQHLRADRFERWLLAEALDTLVEGASRTLRELTSGQYDLGHEKGEFFVVDHHDAGLRRAVRTLSGGETFQASLALALALSEQLAGLSAASASLESIVLDEGFGTLDATTLDTVAVTLENLAARGDRMVGVVTHVGALAERIPVRFEVRRDARTAKIERVGL
ncbi:AAA family ATPase [Dactylosporangium matsuzakiense]|uniref:AAA family ATPase n=2 Tax=Dactylosporangium matsuzakiense TaxID=53360 RepID=UPI0021C49EBC|nr:SMC family ATPase [Dactylosporangium matsuzakiense]UWZ46547.1 SMC family ATPase [Dactylosporangium matsuzakiense]